MHPTDRVIGFIRSLKWEALPLEIRHQAKRCLLDGLGALIAGSQTPAAEIMARVAGHQFPGNEATILVRDLKASAGGAVLANAFAANALDIDDGYRLAKGHPGACVLPVILAAAEMTPACCGAELLTALVIGYELGMRAARIRHATYPTYHASGSWGAVAGAAAAGRIMGLAPATLRHAMGIAEYHAPIAPMMKGIAVPSMGKDGIGWGAMVAMLSVLMAVEGFSGIEPLFADTPDHEWIEDLGHNWQIMHLYFKPYAACRWAQPAIAAALALKTRHTIDPDAICEIRVRTFAAACALSTAAPGDTEQAQYNMAFPIAAALLYGMVGPSQVLPPAIFDHRTVTLMNKTTTEAYAPYESAFPEKTYADVVIRTDDGRCFVSARMEPRWEPPDHLPGDNELAQKFAWLVAPVLGQKATQRLIETIHGLEAFDSARKLLDMCRASHNR
jgi:2-methylcitrate dehydratase PrpD